MSLAARNGSWKWTKYPNVSFLHQFCDMISHVASFATLHPSKDIWSVKSICLVHFTAARFWWSVLSLSPALAGKSPKWITEWPSDIEQKYTHPDIDIHKNMCIYIYKSSYRYIYVCVCVCVSLCVLGQRISSPLPKPHTLWINLTFFQLTSSPQFPEMLGHFGCDFSSQSHALNPGKTEGLRSQLYRRPTFGSWEKKQAQVLSKKKPPLK